MKQGCGGVEEREGERRQVQGRMKRECRGDRGGHEQRGRKERKSLISCHFTKRFPIVVPCLIPYLFPP